MSDQLEASVDPLDNTNTDVRILKTQTDVRPVFFYEDEL